MEAAALAAAAAAGFKSEDGKAALVEAGLPSAALALLGGGCSDGSTSTEPCCAGSGACEGAGPAASPEVVVAACSVLITVTNPDDDSQPSSRAFPTARALGKEGAAEALVGALRRTRAAGLPAEAVAALCTALKAVSPGLLAGGWDG